MTRRLRASPAEWPLAGAAAVLLLVLPVCLRVAPRQTLRAAARMTPPRKAAVTRPLGRIVEIVATVSGLPLLAGSCLSRGLAAFVLARRRGVEATLVIGVQRRARGLAAHAWLEGDGRVRPAPPVDDYTPIWRSA